METGRNFTQLGREADVSGQAIQHFMSNSPWSAQAVHLQVQEEIKQTPGLRAGGVLVLDESADEKAGDRSAGASRQYNGRLGKVEMSQVGVFLAYANLKTPGGVWTWVDGVLFLPERWFDEAHAKRRQQLGIPRECRFKTKIELGWEMIQRGKANGLPFELIAFDCLYGQSSWLRGQLRGEGGYTYMGEVPRDTHVYLRPPVLGVPERKSGRGRPPCKVQVLSEEPPVTVEALGRDDQTDWRTIRVRTTERGELDDDFATRRVWTVYEDQAVEEWLVMRRETDGRHSYALSNAPVETPLSQLAWWKCQRYFVERANQEAKSELGWDELEARKYRAWEHHLALTILASWFIAQTRYEWGQTYPRDASLLQEWEVDVLPALSFANVRALLRAVMPLHQLDTRQAIDQVIEHLCKRTRSRKSRLRRQNSNRL